MERLLIISYHYIREKTGLAHPGIHPLTPAEFEEHLSLIPARAGFAEPREAEAFFTGTTSPGDRVLLTFDDGLADHIRAARDFLAPRGIVAAFFIASRPYTERRALPVHKVHFLRSHTPPADFRAALASHLTGDWRTPLTDPDEECRTQSAETYAYDSEADALLKYVLNFVLPLDVLDTVTSTLLEELAGLSEEQFCDEFYLSTSELEELSGSGHLLGAHGHSHKPFSQLDEAAAAEEMEINRRFLREITGREPAWVAYPYGTPRALPADPSAFCRRHRFDIGLTYQSGWNRPGQDPASARRIDATALAEFLPEPPDPAKENS